MSPTTTNLASQQQQQQQQHQSISCRVSVFALGSICNDDRTIELDMEAQQQQQLLLPQTSNNDSSRSLLSTPKATRPRVHTNDAASVPLDYNHNCDDTTSSRSNDDPAIIYAVHQPLNDTSGHQRRRSGHRRQHKQRPKKQVIYESTFSSCVLRAEV